MLQDILVFGVESPTANYILRPGGYIVAQNEKGEIAVVSTPQGIFLPGGGQNPDETPAQAALREAMEECGLRVTLDESFCTADELVFAEEELKHYRKRCAFFLTKSFEIIGSAEADHQLVWLSADEASDRLRHSSQAWAVQKATSLSHSRTT